MDTSSTFTIVGAVIGLFVIVSLVWLGLSIVSDGRKHEESRTRATPATATITAIRHAHASRRSGAVNTELTLKVNSENPPSEPVHVAWTIEPKAMPRVQVGTIVNIKVDPLNPEVVFPNEAWAH